MEKLKCFNCGHQWEGDYSIDDQCPECHSNDITDEEPEIQDCEIVKDETGIRVGTIEQDQFGRIYLGFN